MSAADLPDLLSLSRRIIAGGELTRDEARRAVRPGRRGAVRSVLRRPQGPPSLPRQPRDVLQHSADEVRQLQRGLQVLRQSGHFDTGITPHPMMDGAEVAQACADARDRGASAFGIVNSGRGPTKREWPKIMEAVKAMKEVDGICHCATLGR